VRQVEELATALGSNRNAIYKALSEARRILRVHLAASGRDRAHLPGAPRDWSTLAR
jgi:hypothetical protein